MRETSNWCEDLCESLKNDPILKRYVEDDRREVSRLAKLIAYVELGLTLLHTIAPEEPATTVRDLLSGNRFPAITSDEAWLMLRKARFYLLPYKGKGWLGFLEQYIELPNDLKVYRLNAPSDHPSPSGAYHQRLQLYQQTIRQTPLHQTREVRIATAGRWLAKVVAEEHTPIEVPINIPQQVIDTIPQVPQVNFVHTRAANNPPQTINFDDLLVSAQNMDDELRPQGIMPKYHERLTKVALYLYNESLDDFEQGNCLTLDRILHVVGLLNVGKSTLLEVLTYHFAKQKKRCALIVNDTVSSVRLASLFKHRLQISAAPILGRDRPDHLKKIYEAMLKNEGEEVTQGAMHPVQEWFSVQCPLLSFVDSDVIWDFGKEPCHTLYQKQPTNNRTEQANNDEVYTIGQRDRMIKKNMTCPFYYACPRYQLEQDIATAYVWVLTPASFIHTPVPLMVFSEQIRFAEAVYREFDFLFIDEADRVQIQFDQIFAPSEDLISDDGFINQVGVQVANINNSDRSHASSSLWVDWEGASFYVNRAVTNIYYQLSGQTWLVQWLGKIPFYSYGIFTRIIRELIYPPEDSAVSTSEVSQAKTKIKQILRRIEGFLRNPLDRQVGGELANLADDLIKLKGHSRVVNNIREWCRGWLEQNEIVLEQEEQFEKLTQKIRFAILLTILDAHLIFLVDNLSAFSNFSELEDVTYSLVHRPPIDYLSVIPEAPVGNLLGFLYKPNQDYKGGTLSYFRYLGIGRHLLLNFPELFSVDDHDGPHTILISGTSYAPDSPAYHISHPPTVLLKSTDSNSAIELSQFYFRPQQENGKFIAISGIRERDRREQAITNLINAISPKLLDDIFQDLRDKEQENPDSDLWQDRERILAIMGSYDESEWATTKLKQQYSVGDIERIQTLRRDNSPTYLDGVRRGKIQELKDLPVQIVFAPLMALERGHNILNERQKAAFGAMLFLVRPMPVPDDWQNTVRQLNDWALSNVNNSYNKSTVFEQADEFIKQAFIKLIDLTGRTSNYKQLTPKERNVLCATQAVGIWQIIGRGVRGGVPINVHFLDAKFAPLSAKELVDDETTSLLVGIIKVIESWMNAPRAYQRTITRELYGIFLHVLTHTESLNHEP